MVLDNSNSRYDRLPTNDQIEYENDADRINLDNGYPSVPPTYDDSRGLSEEMEFFEGNDHNQHWISTTHLNDMLVIVKEKIIEPLDVMLRILSDQLDMQLGKIGNPLILRRFFYIFFMSLITYSVISSGYLPNDSIRGSRGMFSDHKTLLQYAKDSIDLAKIERDLEYLSSMPHMSGTRGDTLIKNYILESFENNGLKLVKEYIYGAYATYPDSSKLILYPNEPDKKSINIELGPDNFNPMATGGEVSMASVIYGNKGTMEDLKSLEEAGLLNEDFVLLVDYGKVISDQILIAEKFGAKAILFISDHTDNDKDIVQMKSVAIPNYWAGDAFSPGWDRTSSDASIALSDSKTLPKIPTLPISYNTAQQIFKYLSTDGLKFNNDMFSGKIGDLKSDIQVKVHKRERQPTFDIVGKIEGREQTDKAIVICASRDSASNGFTYPVFGTAMMLSLLELFQQIKYKYDWKPLRNIYFISFGGSEFNYAGATELLEQRLNALKDEVYAVVDISQLGVPDSEHGIDIETHPLLQKFFELDIFKKNFKVNVSNVKSFGDWIPFLANGIPVSIISTPNVRNRILPIASSMDTYVNGKEIFHDKEKRTQVVNVLYEALLISLNLIDKPLIPFDILHYVNTIDDLKKDIEGNFSHKLNFNEIIRGMLLWKSIGKKWTSWMKAWDNIVMSHDQGLEPSLLSVHRWTWNKKLSNIGRRQCKPGGIPGRSFYKNVLFGPALFYDKESEHNWSYPSVRDAIFNEDWDEAQRQINLVGQVLKDSAKLFIEENNDVGY
ncbi:hypothetical protein Kpol_1072p2 [Vanderwaltozyma polyspora DSM 70294]|uniref:Uncharacterized protein n=1 Tax=Vanderwaltozyma polyspora (strain ATCC 22028 / DSM 70294 / BCRC 21397 / CBS 2163 / NBRC 10782 / NRRL Y-8283 / UCD 57-17) TaxID=436907 RepID=A7TKM0_VANPO|nr:uncharacterized protein Kpol_1072p2 [Vanderwaltozyma polyspora DSM 70294]EDO17132.1 hypothetical protein Kpol_1072p2 [Vanderwaltozyma polyspora DSM 70294]